MRVGRLLWAIVFACVYPIASALACDTCASFSANLSADAPQGTWQIGLAQRHTHFDGRATGFIVDNSIFDTEQWMDSSITQFFAQYQLSEQFSLQLTYPFIVRKYKRVLENQVDTGEEYGFGDLTILGQFYPIRYQSGDQLALVQLYSGIKLATGDSDRLREERDSELDSRNLIFRHNSENGTLVGGDDLALGSGSTDVLFGVNFQLGNDRAYFDGDLQYVLRNEGDFDFEYGDEIAWHVGPGYRLLLKHDFSLSLRARLSGESKADDRVLSETIAGSSHDRVFLGPEIAMTFGNSVGANFAVDIPIERESSQEGVEADYRFQGHVSYWF